MQIRQKLLNYCDFDNKADLCKKSMKQNLSEDVSSLIIKI